MIPKAQAKDEQERRAAKQAEELEELLDTAIRLDNGTTPIWVNIDKMSAVAVGLVKRKYEAGGWAVTISHDQRDGSTMVLE